jgi:hypothetical protein
MVPDFCSDIRIEKARIVVLCKLLRAAVAGQKDQSVGYIFRRKSPLGWLDFKDEA